MEIAVGVTSTCDATAIMSAVKEASDDPASAFTSNLLMREPRNWMDSHPPRFFSMVNDGRRFIGTAMCVNGATTFLAGAEAAWLKLIGWSKVRVYGPAPVTLVSLRTSAEVVPIAFTSIWKRSLVVGAAPVLSV